jgi:hypothetical protein
MQMRRTLISPLRVTAAIALMSGLFVAVATQSPTFSQSPQTPARDVSTSCPVTQRPVPPFVPPAPYSAELGPQSFWFGTEKLWTVLHEGGTWNGLPHYTPDDPTFRQKLCFWRTGFDAHSEPRPALRIRGKRLDGAAPPLASDRANAGWQDPEQPFMVTGINLPTLGCWRITAHYRDQELSFVVRVTQ